MLEYLVKHNGKISGTTWSFNSLETMKREWECIGCGYEILAAQDCSESDIKAARDLVWQRRQPEWISK